MSSTRTILVGRFPVSLVGLDEIFEELYQEGKSPSDDLKGFLLSRVKVQNYIPPKAEDEYAQALLREYKKFCRAKEGKEEAVRVVPRTWQGVPREQIPWFPTVYDDLCDGCRKCVEFCPYDVFAWDEETDRPQVANPLNCIVGCTACTRICAPGAITFPPSTMLASLGA